MNARCTGRGQNSLPTAMSGRQAVNQAVRRHSLFKRAILVDVAQRDSRWALAQMSAAEDE